MRQFKVTKNDCYCSYVDFYDTIARKLGANPDNVGKYDCKKISVSHLVQEEQLMWMRDQGMDPTTASMHAACYGPKADIDAPGELIVQVLPGFIIPPNVKSGSKCIKPKSKKAPVKKTASKDIKHKAPTNYKDEIGTFFGVKKPYKPKKK